MSSKPQSGVVERTMPSGSANSSKHKKHHGLVSFIAAVAVLVVAVFVVYSIISDSIQIQNNLQKYDELVSETNTLTAENEQINVYLENDEALDQYIEDIARDKLDFADPDERIYYVVPSSGE